eukprot:m.460140 g.460140  ORF g.460140 m.460140 type:complete len:516 (-) comp21944_c0_seq1:96-1643(-)
MMATLHSYSPDCGIRMRSTLKSPTALATFSGQSMSRAESFSLPIGTIVLAKSDANIYVAEIRGFDMRSGTIAITCPAWPDDAETWVRPSQLFSRSGAAPALLASIENKLRECTDGWSGFKFAVGDVVTVRCGSVARCNGVILGRALRQFDPRDPERDNSHHAFVPTYLVRVELDSEEYYTEEMISPVSVSKSDSGGSSSLAAFSFDGPEIAGVKALLEKSVKPSSTGRRKSRGRAHNLSLDGKSVCRACAFGAHSAHTCGHRGKAVAAKEETGESTTETPSADSTRNRTASPIRADTPDSGNYSPVTCTASPEAVAASPTSLTSTKMDVDVVCESSAFIPDDSALTPKTVDRQRKRLASVDSDVRSDGSLDRPVFPDHEHPHQMRTPEKDDVTRASVSPFNPPSSSTYPLSRRSCPPPATTRFHRRTEPAELLGLAASPASGALFSEPPLAKRPRFENVKSNGRMSMTFKSGDTRCADCDGFVADFPIASILDRCATCAALEDCAVQLTLNQCTL